MSSSNLFRTLSLVGALFAFAPSVLAEVSKSASTLCETWEPPREIGALDTSILDEESGLAVSRQYDKLYHVNDSGDGAYFYITDRDGRGTRKIEIDIGKPKDTEEIALGPCPAGGTCLAIADIGDNMQKRKFIEVVYIEESSQFPDKVSPTARVKLKYPDGAHNAEAFSILPNGDLIIVTKEGSWKRESKPAQIFRARKSQIVAHVRSPKSDPLILQRLGEIDVPKIVGQPGGGGLVTAMSMASDGKRFALLTYATAVEFNLDLAQEKLPSLSQLKPQVDYRVVPLAPLAQQESLSYDSNDRDLLYSTEVNRGLASLFGKKQTSPLMKVRCK